MISIEIKDGSKAKVNIEGNMGVVYQELALAVTLIMDNYNSEFEEGDENKLTIDDVMNEIKECIVS